MIALFVLFILAWVFFYLGIKVAEGCIRGMIWAIDFSLWVLFLLFLLFFFI